MNAIRRIVEVKNHSINIELPTDFQADEVEVIIFPKEDEENFYVSEEEKALMLKRLADTPEEDFEDWETAKLDFL